MRISSSIKFVRLFFQLWRHHQIPLRAAALTYTLMLALVPLLVVGLSASSLVVDVHSLGNEFKDLLVQHLTTGSGNVVAAQIDKVIAHTQFKALGFAGFGALLITALLLLSGIEESINRIWSIRKKKKIWKRFLIYNLILILGPASVSFSIATTAVIAKYFPQLLLRANLGAILVSAIFLTLTFKIFPNKKVNWRAAGIAGLATTLCCELAKWAYAAYIAKTLIHNKLYGGLAALPLFLIWVYVNWIIFLGGALLTFVLQHHKSYKLRGRE